MKSLLTFALSIALAAAVSSVGLVASAEAATAPAHSKACKAGHCAKKPHHVAATPPKAY
jgi:hypothetical protein